MSRIRSNRRIILVALPIVLAVGMMLHLLSEEGRSSMKSAISPGTVTAGKPQIDEIVPRNLMTATFAMG